MTLQATARPLALAALASCLAAGCVHRNERLTIGPVTGPQDGGVLLPALGGDPAQAVPTDASAPPPPAEPSLAVRSWPAVTVSAPVDGTWHRPLYGRPFFGAPATPRRAGDFPTIDDAMLTDPREGIISESMGGPLKAGADAALLPIRLVVVPPWKELRSPSIGAYDRQPRYTFSGGVFVPAAPPAAEPSPQQPTGEP